MRYNPPARFARYFLSGRLFDAKAHISTQSTSPTARARLPKKDEVTWRSSGDQSTAPQRSTSFDRADERAREEDQLEGIRASQLAMARHGSVRRMDRRYRLTNTTDFKRVRRTGKSFAHPFAILQTCPNDLAHSRFGFVAGKTVGNAVHRNRAKRILREIIRPLISEIRSGNDVVLIARPAILSSNWMEVTSAVQSLLVRASLMEVAGNNDSTSRTH